MPCTFQGDFVGPAVDADRWVDHYLPRWSTPERSAARYRLGDDGLTLLVEADQPAWRTEDGPMRVSNPQTGSFSGPLGPSRDQHRHRPDLTVTTRVPTRRLWTPGAGGVEATARASDDPAVMLAAWTVGVEQPSPTASGEVCVAERYGSAIGSEGSLVRSGIKAHHDPTLHDDVEDVPLDLDATEWHVYAAEWDADHATFSVDGVVTRSLDQGVDYPLQLMVDLFEFPVDDHRDPARYPKTGHVRSVRGFEPATVR